MKKNLKVLMFSVIGVLILAGTVFVLQLLQGEDIPTEEEPPNKAEQIVFTNFNTEDVVSIHVKNQEDEYTVVRTGNDFTISELDELEVKIPYEYMRLYHIGDAAAKLSAISLVEENAEDLEQYGLSDENNRAEATASFKDKSEISFIIGDNAPDFISIYFKLSENNNVYTVDAQGLALFLKSRFYFVNHQAFPSYDTNKAPEISRVSIERIGLDKPIVIEALPEQPLEEVRTFNTHKLTSPVSVELDQDKSRFVLLGIFGLTAIDVMAISPDDETLETGKLTDPLCVVEVVVGKDTTYTLTIGERLRNEAGEILGWLGMSSEVPDILFLFDADTLPWLYVEAGDIVAESFLMPYIYSVYSLEVEAGEHRLSFVIQGDSEDNTVWQRATDNSDDEWELSGIERERFGDFYRFLISARGEELFLDENKNNELIAKITYSYRDESRDNDVIEYYKAADRKSIIRINGENMFKTSSLYTSRLTENIEAFIDGKNLVMDW
jgi:hypothetical protein